MLFQTMELWTRAPFNAMSHMSAVASVNQLGESALNVKPRAHKPPCVWSAIGSVVAVVAPSAHFIGDPMTIGHLKTRSGANRVTARSNDGDSSPRLVAPWCHH